MNIDYKSNTKLVKDNELNKYVIEKTERIAAALLLISSSIDDTSAYCKGLSDAAIRLVKAANMYGGSAPRELSAVCRYCSSLIRSAHMGGLITGMNSSIMCKEIKTLINDIEGYKWSERSDMLQREMFTATRPEMETLHSLDTYMMEGEDQYSHITDEKQRGHGQQKGQYQRANYGESKETDAGGNASIQNRSSHSINMVKKDRRAVILGLLQKKERISIKDVSLVVKDCSEKTLQRELLALVAQGVLKKEGEKRWSTYALV